MMLVGHHLAKPPNRDVVRIGVTTAAFQFWSPSATTWAQRCPLRLLHWVAATWWHRSVRGVHSVSLAAISRLFLLRFCAQKRCICRGFGRKLTIISRHLPEWFYSGTYIITSNYQLPHLRRGLQDIDELVQCFLHIPGCVRAGVAVLQEFPHGRAIDITRSLRTR